MPAIFPISWLSVVPVFGFVRYPYVVKAPTSDKALQTHRARSLSALLLIQGLYYASAAFFFAFFTPIEQVITTMIIVCLCSALVTSVSGYPEKVKFYIAIPLFAIAAAWMLWGDAIQPHWANEAIAILVLVYMLVLNGNREVASSMFTESFRSRQRQAQLNGQLQELNNQLQTALHTAETANRAKTRFLASASHDLRQPIHTLSIFSAALDLKPLTEDVKEITDNMNAALENLASQLDALLDVSKLDAGVIKVKTTAINLAPLTQRLERDCRPLCENKNLELRISCEAECLVSSDATLLERVLRNLLFNAIKYTQAGHIEFKAVQYADHCAIEISDTGKGIPQEEQERVFEEFYQLDNPERDRSKGLGLGLAIVRRLLDLLGIQMILDSSPGHGTRFTLRLPLANSLDIEEEQADLPYPGTIKDIHVLVIDDEIAVRSAMKTLIQAMGCEVNTTDSTKSAIKLSEIDPPDIVLADFRLRGDDDGIKAIRAIRKKFPGLPALLISGDTAPERLRQAADAGIELLHKPVSISALRKAMTAALTNNK